MSENMSESESENEIYCYTCEEENLQPKKQSKFCEEICEEHYTCEQCNKPILELAEYNCYKCIRDDNDYEDEDMHKYYNENHDNCIIQKDGKYYYQSTCQYHGSAILCKKCSLSNKKFV